MEEKAMSYRYFAGKIWKILTKVGCEDLQSGPIDEDTHSCCEPEGWAGGMLLTVIKGEWRRPDRKRQQAVSNHSEPEAGDWTSLRKCRRIGPELLIAQEGITLTYRTHDFPQKGGGGTGVCRLSNIYYRCCTD